MPLLYPILCLPFGLKCSAFESELSKIFLFLQPYIKLQWCNNMVRLNLFFDLPIFLTNNTFFDVSYNYIDKTFLIISSYEVASYVDATFWFWPTIMTHLNNFRRKIIYLYKWWIVSSSLSCPNNESSFFTWFHCVT